ncbi:MAG: hypothetical protein M3495_09105 [Pseudomonadota bacterium]|nr:hypothetical protein [Gammaproteobacteria bacterium]MDQ3581747.1 hypothetical protein [Pseudomonadota bacterium]
MKHVDPRIIVTGPDLSEYDENFMNALTECPTGCDDITGPLPGQPREGGPLYYVDILNFHRYRFDGDDGYNRQEVIAEPAGGFQEKLDLLKGRVEACNDITGHNRTGKSALKMAVTEMNITFKNPLDPDPANPGLDEWGAVGATSFLAGQFWAEAMSVGMKNGLVGITFWSVKEGDNLGYIKNDGRKLSTYYHFQLMANNFRGEYAAGTDLDASNADIPEVKAFGSKARDQIVVMILNQTTSTDYDYTLRFDTNTVSGANPLKINIAAGVNAEYNSTTPLLKESTVMLVFNESGILQKTYVYSVEHARNDQAPTECPPDC